MYTLLMVLGSLSLVVGSIVAAMLVGYALWLLFRFVGHPELSAIALLIATPLAVAASTSQFVRMTAFFAVVAAVPLWFVGREWRVRHN
ncbi:hypothetical protein NED98_17150 [Sphingomonas sp. MMSM20]|uniref:hypothetical protein n=1 Tax=Sphingomonas lycopersici TaxID=2951807 RepID=UPI002238D379|nr:hypothetical protein [Sphingomonas lycopersici]MCW6531977.1 hypothetical protein [Sphingomonas lycopersici]